VLIFASIITFKKGIFTVGLDALILAGAVLGFLPYNFPEAKTLSVIVVLKRWVLYWAYCPCWHVQEYCWNYLFWFFATSLLPVEDTLSAWFRRLAAGQHPFTADRKHLHHKLLDWD